MILFIEGLKPSKLMRFVKEITPTDLQAAINQTKWSKTINITTYYLPNSTSMIVGHEFPNFLIY
jgi:hypothetical protein